ncbi:esterase-like activity of phytase family protein [uncultured Imperialibacter sp.]|uniref:esterase-like activity of phytase family protein n=1 Tax=uncultured Imperialibacter sp. TaxID=1672639 RepID=UPI0030D71CB0
MKLTRRRIGSIAFFILCFIIPKWAQAQISFDTQHSFFIEIPFDTSGVIEGQEKPFGGISAITYSGHESDYYLLSDGLPARYYTFTIDPIKGQRIVYKDLHYLAESQIRGEGMALAGPKMFISDERDIDNVEKTLVWQTDASGKLQNIKDLPAKYYGEMYDNSGFEGLTISPDHKKLFLAMERALPTSGCRSILPILEYSLGDHSTKTYWYQMQWDTKGNGISSLVALSDYELLVIERDYLKAEDRNEVNIYKITLIEPSNNNDSDCPQSGDPVLVPEKIFSFTQDLKLGGQPYKVNNIEGATFTPDGQYLLLVSDNNFGNKGNGTPTQLVALKVAKL